MRILDDAEGDARVMDSRSVFINAAWRGCNAVGNTARETCWSTSQQTAAALPPVGGVDAPSGLDIVGLEFTETQDALGITVEVARLDEDLRALQPQGVERPWASWRTCWTSGPDEVNECAFLTVAARPDDTFLLTAHDIYSTECNDWEWCSTAVPFDLEYGEPGRIHLEVPRAIMWAAEAGDELGSIWVETAQGSMQGVIVARWSAGIEQGGADSFIRDTVDTAHAPQPFRFEIPRGTFDANDLTQTSFKGSALFATDRQDLDIREVHLVEDPENFTIAVLLAQVDEEPQDHRFTAGLGVPTGRIHTAGYRADGDGHREEWAGTCSDPECSDWISYDVEIAFDPGSPGWVNLSFSRTDIDAPMEGDRLNVAFAQMTGPREPFPFLGAGIGPAGIGAEWTVIGWSGVAPPYYFQQDTKA